MEGGSRVELMVSLLRARESEIEEVIAGHIRFDFSREILKVEFAKNETLPKKQEARNGNHKNH